MASLKNWAARSVLVAAMISASASLAWADVPTGAPNADAPTDQAAGPVVWDMNQEMSALMTARAPEPEFAPKGIPLGGPWRLFTDFVSNFSYDDNVYRVTRGVGTGPESDWFFTESPTVVLDYSTSFLHLDAYADATFNEYARLSQVDNTEYDAGLRGAYVISRAAQTSFNISYSQDAQPLSSPDNVGFQARPTLYNDTNANWQFKYQPNRLGFTVGFNLDNDSYQETPVLGGGPEINLAFRNDTMYTGFVEGDYDFSPGYEGFLRATYKSDQYQHYYDFPTDPAIEEHRSSTDEQYDAGLKMLLTNLVQGQVYVGYLTDHYDEHQPNPLKDISGLDFGASLTWFPTELLTLHLAGQRSIEDTTIFSASGGDDKNVTLTADYELTRRVHLDLNAGYDAVVYNVVPTNQDIDTTTVGVGAKWLISHYVQGVLAYQYSTRSSNVHTFVYNDNLLTVGLNFQI